MEYSVQVEKPSNILRKLIVKVPAGIVAKRLDRGLAEVQRTAKIKGFRPGHVPITVIKQYYGDDVRHQVFHNLIDESYREVVRSEKIQPVGSPKIETPEHKTGEGAHDHSLHEGQDLHYVATVEVLPEIDVKGYTGIALTQGKVSLTDQDVELVVKNLRDSQAELIPLAGGLTMPDGTQAASRPVQKGDHVDMAFKGGVVTETGIEEKPGMSGSRVLEVGSDSLIPGFEENLIGMNRGQTKTFNVPFPADFYEADLAGKEAQFTVTINEIKEKKLPALDDEYAKQLGYESVDDLRAKAKEHLTQERTQEVDRKLRSDLLQVLIEKNPFDVPEALVQAQTRALAQDVAQNLKQQGFTDQMVQEAVVAELDNLKKRADNQVRASLILEAIAKKEGITVTPDELEAEFKKAAASMRVEEPKLREYYQKNPERMADLEFRIREERTMKLLKEKSKIKQEK